MEDPRIAPRSHRPATLVLLIVASVVWTASLLPAGFAIMFSPMAFDAGYEPWAVALVALLLSYPVIVVVGLIGAWWAYARRRHRGALLFALLPLVPVVALGVLFAVFG